MILDDGYWMRPCACLHDHHDLRLVVVTGGPGASKTAVLEMARRTIVDSAADFSTKASRSLEAIAAQLPTCCDPSRT